MIDWLRSDRGQAFPIYVVAIAALLFAALAFFVVGMAGATRSDAQGAADAAALAAAREARDNVFIGLDLTALRPTDWQTIVEGRSIEARGACAKAVEFAALNDATAQCRAALPEFAVSVTTNGTVGSSVVPGSSDMQARASATAVIEPRCSLRSAPVPAPTPTGSSSPAPSMSPSPAPAGVAFVCRGKLLQLDPAKPGPLQRLARALFTVRLAD
ncbi:MULTISPECIES: pilus assembly protein TadG-related protein [Streptomyces]|uniref:pilus assembly protein TadG-related protein n=1 Tax=Streptomyces TaxID=1883 RepID=UPI001675756A|nr:MULTISPECIES: pilus assembly protein TadG-related protein [Streptomyces]MBD3576498.1 hypothetical protein [Streptomyces sp. KD18]GGS88798.1 hypothetical protein GCM10010286_11910 [Streptomyces toxytricini]